MPSSLLQYLAALYNNPTSGSPLPCVNIWLRSTMCQYMAVFYHATISECPLLCYNIELPSIDLLFANTWLASTMCQYLAALYYVLSEAHHNLLQCASLQRRNKFGGRSCTIQYIILNNGILKLNS